MGKDSKDILQYNKKTKECGVYIMTCVANLIIFGIILGGIILLLLYGLAPIMQTNTSVQELESTNLVQISLGHQSVLVIQDGDECTSSKLGACIFSKCQKSQTQQEYTEQCQMNLYISNPINFHQFVIQCEQGRCDIKFNSTNLSTTYLYIYGEEAHLQGTQIQADTVFFDTDMGSFKVQDFSFQNAYLNSNQGDIAIQSRDHVRLSTITTSEAVCVSGPNYLNVKYKILNKIEDIMIQSDPTKDECFKVYPYLDHRFDQMIATNKHPVFDTLVDVNIKNYSEQRCNRINSLLLMNAFESVGPNTIFKNLWASTSEGNIYLNVLNILDEVGIPLQNSFYNLENVQFSPNSASHLNDTLNNIQSSSQFNQMVFLDFHQGFNYSSLLQLNIIYSSFLFAVNPMFLSILSLNTQSSQLNKIDVQLTPGLCPYIFNFTQTRIQYAEYQRSQIVQSVLGNFLTQNSLNPFVVMNQQDFNNFNIKDILSYPLAQYQDIQRKLQLVGATTALCQAVSVVLLIIIASIIFPAHYDDQQIRINRQKIKSLFLLLQQQEYTKESQSENEEINSVNRSGGSSNDEQQKKLLLVEKNPATDKAEMKINYNMTNIGQCYSFQEIIANMIRDITVTNSNSLEFFCRNFFINTTKSSDDQLIEISMKDFNVLYQLFCYFYTLSEEYLFDETSQRIIQNYQYSFVQDFAINTAKKPSYQINFSQREYKSIEDEENKKVEENKIEKRDIELVELKVEQDDCQNMFDSSYPLMDNELTIAQYFKMRDDKCGAIDYKQKKKYNFENYSSNLRQTQEKEEEYLSEVDVSALRKRSDRVLLARKPLSRFVINKTFVDNFFYLFKYHFYRRQNILFSEQTDYVYGSCTEKQAINLVTSINSSFSVHSFQRRSYQTKIDFLLSRIKFITTNLVYVCTPLAVVVPSIIIIFIAVNESNKALLAQQEFPNSVPLYGISDILNFNLAFPGFVTYGLTIYLSITYIQMMYYNKLSASSLAFTLLETDVDNQEFREGEVYDCLHCIFIPLGLFTNLITLNVFCLQTYFLIIVFMIMIIGAMVYPSVQLPVLIFVIFLLGVISLQVSDFSQGLSEGKQLMRKKFKQNFLDNFEAYKSKLNNKEIPKKKATKVVIPTRNRLSQIFVRQFNRLIEAPNKIPKKSYQSIPNHQPKSKVLLDDNLDSIGLNIDFEEQDELTEIFNFIDTTSQQKISEEILIKFFRDIDMSLSSVQINKLYARVLFSFNKEKQFKRGSDFKKLICKEFRYFVESLLSYKVEKALNYMNISYNVLFFNVAQTLFQSFIIAYFIYSIFYGLKSDSSSFDFSSSSIISFGGIIGVLFTAKTNPALQDEALVNSTLDKVEKVTHSYNK